MRSYPLRFSRNYWRIPLNCIHECSPACAMSISYEREHKTNSDNEDILNISATITRNDTYRDGRCSEYNQIIPTFIPIAEYNVSCPTGHIGALHHPDMVVIQDDFFTLSIRFPTTVNASMKVHVPSSNMVTLRQLLWLIKKSYEFVYEEEERTASPTLVRVEDVCTDCTESSLEEAISERTQTIQGVEGTQCAVCYMELLGEVTTLQCKHLYHKECLLNWVRKGSGQTCPLCRTPLLHCKTCENTHIITQEQEFVVIPPHLREHPFRNTTDGVYGIYDFDLEQLAIESIYYNRINKHVDVVTHTI
jgi:hypothetical protein